LHGVATSRAVSPQNQRRTLRKARRFSPRREQQPSRPLGPRKTQPKPPIPQAHSSKSTRRRAGATGGGFGSNPMCINIFSITPRSSMTAMSFSLARVLRPFDAQSSADLMTGIRQAIQRSDRPELADRVNSLLRP
jgi:hypothetical protein